MMERREEKKIHEKKARVKKQGEGGLMWREKYGGQQKKNGHTKDKIPPLSTEFDLT
jgi:hypothetical protein